MRATADIYGSCEGDAGQYARGYLSDLAVLFETIDIDSVARFIDRLDRARLEGQTIFLAGNGGSAATASHMGNDLLNLAHKCPGFAPPFQVVALTDNMPAFSAIANDDGYDQVFVRQLTPLFRPGDVVVSISASGSSPNLLEAAFAAREQEGICLGLLGFDGGQLLDVCDESILIRTEKGEYGFVEDTHLVMNHLITSWFHQHYRDD